MFPTRFFPDRFFAPRYFAKVGATATFNAAFVRFNRVVGPGLTILDD